MNTSYDDAAQYGLLLLPMPPRPPSSATLRAAYGDPLHDAIEGVMNGCAPGVLDVALPIWNLDFNNRSVSFAPVASLVNGIYELLNSILHGNIAVPTAHPLVNVRVILLEYDTSRTYQAALERAGWQLDVVASLPVLVESERRWNRLFVVQSEEGESLYRKFRAVAVGRFGSTCVQILSRTPTRVRGGTIMREKRITYGVPSLTPRAHSRVVACGEFISIGLPEKALLTMAAFLVGRRTLRQKDCDAPRLDLLVDGAGFMAEQERRSNLIKCVASFLDAIVNFQSEKPHAAVPEAASRWPIMGLWADIRLAVRDDLFEDPLAPLTVVGFEQRRQSVEESFDAAANMTFFTIPELPQDSPQKHRSLLSL